ncbi:hypothetical protein [Pseudomonas alkylphenolica]|uniref:hypothetical protein n=1 Tax=Pseudomonas alkylphenolica TaxID=237609 RepID=UPI00315C54BD
MQKLIFAALLVIMVLLAPWTLGWLLAAFSVWAVVAVIVAVCGGAAMLWLHYSTDYEREQKRLEKRIKKITEEANRANARRD